MNKDAIGELFARVGIFVLIVALALLVISFLNDIFL